MEEKVLLKENNVLWFWHK